MDFEKLFNDLRIKADNLDTAMQIMQNKNTCYSENLRNLNEDLSGIKDLEKQAKEAIVQHNAEIKEEYSEVREHIERVNAKMLFLLNALESIVPDQNGNAQQQQAMLSDLKSPKVLQRQNAAFSDLNTPRMSIDEYAKSPFAKKKGPSKQQLKFSDFEIEEITDEKFNKIPAYIRGRMNKSDLQHFLQEVVLKCFNSKYELLHKNRAVLKPSDFSLQQFFLQQVSYFEGQKFITMGDLSRTRERNIDKKDEKYLQCLRFLHIIKEVRKNSVVCYIWLDK